MLRSSNRLAFHFFYEEIKSVNDFDAFRRLILGNSFEVLYLLLSVLQPKCWFTVYLWIFCNVNASFLDDGRGVENAGRCLYIFWAYVF